MRFGVLLVDDTKASNSIHKAQHDVNVVDTSTIVMLLCKVLGPLVVFDGHIHLLVYLKEHMILFLLACDKKGMNVGRNVRSR